MYVKPVLRVCEEGVNIGHCKEKRRKKKLALSKKKYFRNQSTRFLKVGFMIQVQG